MITMTKRNKHIGSSLNDFLKDEGIPEEGKSRPPEIQGLTGNQEAPLKKEYKAR
jgi:hypothetical protein